MQKSTVARIWEWSSYVLILGATVYYFASGKQVGITMIVVFLAVFCFALMYRTRCKMYEEENEELKSDLRRLTNLLEIAKKSQKSDDKPRE